MDLDPFFLVLPQIFLVGIPVNRRKQWHHFKNTRCQSISHKDVGGGLHISYLVAYRDIASRTLEIIVNGLWDTSSTTETGPSHVKLLPLSPI
mmetsp:Transcript_26933/g.38214  ORF Transcript_26933/g.38214 Transcript_26933/m.38214 type:complete len:92 (-) Transcript_26933:342-617(-)